MWNGPTRSFSFSFTLVVGLVLSAGALAAQSPAVLSGQVRSQDGRPVQGAELHFSAGEVDTTSAEGRFRLEVSAGTAGTLSLRAVGFAPAELAVAPVAAGGRREIAVTLAPLYILDAITVVASRDRPLLNTQDATTGGAVEAAEIQALPTEARDPLALLTNVPGVAQSSGFFGDAPSLSFNALNGLYTNYALDGLDNNEGFLGGPRVEFPLGGLAREEALVNTYSSEYGRSPSGIVNQLTKAGSNNAHGEVFGYYRPGRPFDARSKVPFGTDPTGRDILNRRQDGFRRYHIGGGLSGPIVRDRTFASGAVEYSDENEDRVSSTARTAFVGTEKREKLKLFGRLDHGWSPTQTTTLRAAYSWVSRAGQGGGVVTPEADVTTRRVGSLTALTHRSVLADGQASNTASIQLGTFRWYFPPTNSTLQQPQVTILDSATSATLAVVGSSNFIFDESETQLQLRDVFERQWGGGHTFKAGGEALRSWFKLTGSNTNPKGAYAVFNDPGNPIPKSGRFITFADLPANVRVASYTIDANPAQVNLTQSLVGAFVEDRWRVSPSLLVIGGLRWDYDDITSRGLSQPDLNNFQPRFSFNWYATPRSVLRGGAGMYAGKFPYAIFSDAVQFGPNGNATVRFDSTTGVAAPAFGQGLTPQQLQQQRSLLPPREQRVMFARGLQQPMSYQATVGYQFQVGNDWAFSIDGVFSETRNLPRSFDLNAVNYQLTPGDTSVIASKTTASGDSLRPVLPVNGSYRRLTTTESAGKSRYWGLYLSARRQLSAQWSVDANWVWSHARNDTEDINFNAAVGNDFAAEWADASNDRRHKVTLRTIYTVADRVRVSLIGDFQTGLPVNRVAGAINPDGSTVTYDLTGSGGVFGDGFIGNTSRYYGVRRNAERLPSFFNLSSSVTYLLGTRIGEFEFRADVFNILNGTQWGNFANGITGGGSRTQFGHPGDPIVLRSPGPPRQVQFSTRYIF
ncbi:MAG: TonB-dependent receptor [Gemmatimonadota bacterium]|nr:TonB-dependent receptor [Gemmatimonadota bacterium]